MQNIPELEPTTQSTTEGTAVRVAKPQSANELYVKKR